MTDSYSSLKAWMLPSLGSLAQPPSHVHPISIISIPSPSSPSHLHISIPSPSSPSHLHHLHPISIISIILIPSPSSLSYPTHPHPIPILSHLCSVSMAPPVLTLVMLRTSVPEGYGRRRQTGGNRWRGQLSSGTGSIQQQLGCTPWVGLLSPPLVAAIVHILGVAWYTR